MERVAVLAVLVILLSTGVAPEAAHSVNMVDRYLHWFVDVDSPQPHIKSRTLAYLVTEGFQLVAVNLEYGNGRSFNMDEAPARKSKGKIIAKLEVLKGNRTVLIGSKKIKIRPLAWNPRYTWRASAGWADRSGWDTGDTDFKKTKRLPIDLEPGDVILWTVKFKGVKALDYRDAGDGTWYRDHASLQAGFFNCGTHDRPCY